MEEDRGKIEERMVNGARGVYIVVQAARGRPCPSWHTKPFGVVHRQFTLEKGSTIILSWQCLMSQPLLKPSLASPDAEKLVASRIRMRLKFILRSPLGNLFSVQQFYFECICSMASERTGLAVVLCSVHSVFAHHRSLLRVQSSSPRNGL
jgi:hypothetical protein